MKQSKQKITPIGGVSNISHKEFNRLRKKGMHGVSGYLVKLDCWMIGGEWTTTDQALRLFRERLRDPSYCPYGSSPQDRVFPRPKPSPRPKSIKKNRKGKKKPHPPQVTPTPDNPTTKDKSHKAPNLTGISAQRQQVIDIEIKKCSYNYIERNQILRDMGYSSYADYLAGDLWLSIRDRVLAEMTQCCCCGISSLLQVHHRQYTYANLSGESIDSLVAICHRCHIGVEFTRNGEKRFSSDGHSGVRCKATKPRPLKKRRVSRRKSTMGNPYLFEKTSVVKKFKPYESFKSNIPAVSSSRYPVGRSPATKHMTPT